MERGEIRRETSELGGTENEFSVFKGCMKSRRGKKKIPRDQKNVLKGMGKGGKKARRIHLGN